MIQTSYSDARANFAKYLDQVVDDCETVVIRRRGKADVAMIGADELRSLQETLHVLTPPENGRRLLEAIAEAEHGDVFEVSIEELRHVVETGEQPARLAEALREREQAKARG